MGETYVDFDLLDDMIRAIGKHAPMEPKELAKKVGHSEEAVLEQLTESYYFEASPREGKPGRYQLSSQGVERLEKIT